MLALKKKREAEAKAKAAAAAAGEQAEQPTSAPAEEKKKVSLLGVGGKKKKDSGESKGGKKRTPGEIRIQKGECTDLMDTTMEAYLLSSHASVENHQVIETAKKSPILRLHFFSSFLMLFLFLV